MLSAPPTRFLIPEAQRYLPSLHFFFNPQATAHFLSRSSPPQRVFSPMAGAAENFSSDATTDELKFGFQRPEMYKSSLAGTVMAYDRHVFLCYKTYESWPSRVEDSESDPLPKLLAGALKARKDDINVKTLLTICEGREGTGFSDGDVLIFPEMVKYRGLKDSNVDSFVEDVLVNGKPWASGVPELMAGSHVFVCAHGSRDQRCGVCGPVLIDKLNEEIGHRGLKGQVFVSGCSHIGGHKFAGNLIVFSTGQDGKIAGNWYGYVTPNDVAEVLDQDIGNGEVIKRLLRGQMGVPVELAENGDEQKIPNGSKNPKGDSLNKKDDVASCCQDVKGFSCCKDGSSETAEVQGKKGKRKQSSWMGNWEEKDVLIAVSVVGAMAAVAVAYSYYKRSR